MLRHQEHTFWDWLLATEIQVVDLALADMQGIRKWRDEYPDREVDFADASLVWLAIERQTNLIATTDFADFETYRLPKRKAFKLLIKRP